MKITRASLFWILATVAVVIDLWLPTLQAAMDGETLHWTLALATVILTGGLAVLGFSALRHTAKLRDEVDPIIQSSPQGIAVLKAARDRGGKITDFKIIRANTAVESETGRPVNQVIGQSLLKVAPHVRDNGDFDRICRVIETGRPESSLQQDEFQGVTRWLNIHFSRLNDGAVLVMENVTARKKMEDDLRQSEQLLAKAEAISQVGAWSVSFPNRRVTWTKQLRKLREAPEDYQPTLEEALNFYAEECRDVITEAFERCARDGTPYDLELEMITAKGRRIAVRSIGEADFRDGKLFQIFGTLQDITQARQAMGYERELRVHAQIAERAKGDFLTLMSHEIRTPLNGILGFADELAAKPLAPEDHEAAKTILQCGQSLLRILDDILDYTRIETEQVELQETLFSPAQLVDEVRQHLASDTILKHNPAVTLETQIGRGLPDRVLGDAGRLRQLLLNFGSNALKFTNQGHVRVAVRRDPHPSEPDYHRLIFEVQDTGIGIPGDKLEEIFEPFAQAEVGIARRYGGTGMGLALSRRIADLLRGTLNLETEVGHGSTFGITLDLKAANGAIPDPPVNATLPLF